MLASDEVSALPILAAIATTFAATNIDDIVLLTLFFARRVPTYKVVAGQYLGFAAIILLSCVGLLLTVTIPHQWIRYLGMVPLLLGFKQLILLFKRDKQQKDLPADRQSIMADTLVWGDPSPCASLPRLRQEAFAGYAHQFRLSHLTFSSQENAQHAVAKSHSSIMAQMTAATLKLYPDHLDDRPACGGCGGISFLPTLTGQDH